MIPKSAQGDVALLRHQLDMKKMMRDALRDKRDKLTQVEHISTTSVCLLS